MSSTAAHERRALATALRGVDPGAPTLCEGWDAHDLAAHIVIRDSRPDAMLAERLPVLGTPARRVLDQIAGLEYPRLLDRIEQGPPRRSPMRLSPVADLADTAEFFVHTEDVLRAQADAGPQNRRTIPQSVRRRLWAQASRSVFVLAARQQRRRITFLSPGFGAATVGRTSHPLLLVQGRPEELVLWAFGREGAADVDLSRP